MPEPARIFGKWKEYHKVRAQQDLCGHSNYVVICFVSLIYLLRRAVHNCENSKPSGELCEVGCDHGVDAIKLAYTYFRAFLVISQ